MNATRELSVSVNDRLVGKLTADNDIWSFTYETSWQQWPGAFSLAPGLPLTQVAHIDGSSNRPVQWYFDNLLPEEALRTVLSKEEGLDEADAFGLLACFGAESAGSLVLAGPHTSEPLTGLVALSLQDLNQRIKNLPRATLTKNSPKRMSLAGAQHKMVVVYRDGQLFEPQKGTASTHILKPNSQSSDYPASVMNEYFTMKLARAVGLDVPDVFRVYAPEPAYLIERFDRFKVDGVTHRRHIIDTCQLLGKSRSFKYAQANLQALQDAVGKCTAKVTTRLRLYRWVLFNFFVGNADNHLKNISFSVSHEGIGIAPAYDLLCTAVYDTLSFIGQGAHWPNVVLALSLGDATHFSGVTRASLLNVGASLGLAPATTNRELADMEKSLPVQADKLIEKIENDFKSLISASPDPDGAKLHQAGELRLIRAIRHVVLSQTLMQVKSI